MSGQAFIRAVVAAFMLAVAGASAVLAIVPASAAECRDAVQGKLAWNAHGDTHWSPQNVAKLCKGAEQSPEPANCFQTVMSGKVPWQGADGWSWESAIALCRGSHRAQANITCLQDARAKGLVGPQTIEKCQSVGASVPAAELANPTVPLAMTAGGEARAAAAPTLQPPLTANVMRSRMAATRNLDNMLRLAPGADMSPAEAQYVADMREKALALRTVFARQTDLHGLLEQARHELSEVPDSEAFAVHRAKIGYRIEALEKQLAATQNDAQLAVTDLQNALQKQQQDLETMSNVAKAMHDMGLGVIRNLE